MSNNIQLMISFFVYLSFMVFIGFYFYKRTNTSTDYFLGGRTLGSWVTSMSAQASDMSGWLLMGLPGAAYMSGISASWIAIGLAIGTYINWRFIAKRLRQYTKISEDSITIPQFFSNRFKDTSGALKLISSIFILIFYLIYTSSGFVACATLFSSVFGISYTTSLIIGIFIIVSYTFAGGFFAVSWTDFFQGILMFFAVLAVPAIAINNLGGFGEFTSKIAEFNPNFLNIFTNADGSKLTAIALISLLAWGLGYFGQPHILIRFMGIKSPGAIKKSRRIATVWTIISLIAAVLIGMSGRLFISKDLTSVAGETIYLEMVTSIFPVFIAGIFLCAVLAAIMSTADSQLLVTASSITEDFYKSIFKKNASGKERMWVGRLTVVFVAIIAGFMANNPANTILGLVENAWAGFGATFGPLVICSLYYKKTTRNGAIAGILTGGLTTIIWRYLAPTFGGIFTLYEIVPGFIFSLIAILIFSNIGQKPTPEMLEEFNTYTNCEE